MVRLRSSHPPTAAPAGLAQGSPWPPGSEWLLRWQRLELRAFLWKWPSWGGSLQSVGILGVGKTQAEQETSTLENTEEMHER